jgi:hypothetical protein
MAATTTLLGLVTPTQGTLSGTWGDTVNYGISDYVDISVAGTLTLTNDGAVTLANTTGSSSGNSITSSLTGAGTVTAQFAIVKVTGTLTVAKVVTGPSYSKTYTVVNAATGGIVTFKASGQTGVSVAVGETAFVYYNGTDYVKVSGTVAVASFQTSLGGLTPSTATTGVVTLAGTLNTTSGGTGLTSFTAGDVPYYASGSVLSKLAIGTAGQFLTSTGTAPQWSTLSGVAVTTFSAGTTGFTPSSATSGAVTLAGTLATTNGGTGLTSFTSGGVVYASSSSVLATGSGLIWDTNTLSISTANSAPLNLSSSNASATLVQHTNSNASADLFYRFRQNGGGGNWYDLTMLGASNAFTIDYNDNERLRIDSSGNVGIGTSSPVSKLDVSGQVTATGGIFKANGAPSLSAATAGEAILAPEGTYGSLLYGYGSTYDVTISNRTTTPALAVLANSTNVYMAGNVGIGTTTPTDTASFGRALDIQSSGGAAVYLRSSTTNPTTEYFAIGYSPTAAYLYNRANSPMYFYTNATERMRITAAGLVGIGTSSPGATLEIKSDSNEKLILNATLDSNSYQNQLSFKNAGTQYAAIRAGKDGSNVSLGLCFDTGTTERMRIDSAGNVGIGTGSPSTFLTVSGANTAARGQLSVIGASTADPRITLYRGSTFAGAISCTSSQVYIAAVEAVPLAFYTSDTERARIDSSGNLLVGTTSAAANQQGLVVLTPNTGGKLAGAFTNASSSSPYGVGVIYSAMSPNGAGQEFYTASDTTTTRFYVASNGGIGNYSANNVNLSDRREKTNFAPATSYLDKICAIPVQTFNYIDQNLEEDGGLTLGVVAQDVQAVAPELVKESNWAKQGDEPKMRLSIYQTDLQYALMKCIQEQQTIIESLKARLDAANL